MKLTAVLWAVIVLAAMAGAALTLVARGNLARSDLASARTAEAKARLKIMEQTTDGFKVAEEDLKLRGPGEFLGTDQSGRPALRFGDLIADRALVEQARAVVKQSLK